MLSYGGKQMDRIVLQSESHYNFNFKMSKTAEKLSFAQRLILENRSNIDENITAISYEAPKKEKARALQERSQQSRLDYEDLMALLKDFQKEKGKYVNGKMPLCQGSAKIEKKSSIDRKGEMMLEQESMVLREKQENVHLPKWLKNANQPNKNRQRKETTNVVAQVQRSSMPARTSKKMTAVKGITNNGNTCYINAVVQCLFNLPHFNQYFQAGHSTQQTKRNKEVVEVYRALLEDYNKFEQQHLSTVALKRTVSKMCSLFLDWQQEDAHEFMKELLNSLHQSLNRNEKKIKYKRYQDQLQGKNLDYKASYYWKQSQERDNSYIYDCFAGQTYNNITCINCNASSQTFQTLLDLSLPIPPNARSLHELLEHYFGPEKLSDFYFCNSCKKSSKKSTKSLELWKAPKFLILHLKRSQMGRKSMQSLKIPESLSLKQYMKISSDRSAKFCQYSLCGVVMHEGAIEGGHYWAYIKRNGKWYEANDEEVEEKKASQIERQFGQVGSSNAYILFYSSLYS